VSQLAQQLISCLQSSVAGELVATAQLELAEQPLHLQIIDFAQTCRQQGIERMVILPLFLLPGVHVMDDIPAEVAIAEREIHGLKIILAPFLGTCPNFIDLFAHNRLHLPDRSIILAHGSRRQGGNAIVEQLADRLDLVPAYWSIAPSLTDRVTELVEACLSDLDNQATIEIGILPYFLFSGGITDAIAESIAKLRVQFPQVQIILGDPIGNNPELATTIGKILTPPDLHIYR
jgi:sirohydrochlorin ferrochelatase